MKLNATAALAAILAIAAFSGSASAQGSSAQSLYRTRSELDSLATALERAGKRDDAAGVRERLRVGDFYPGDQVFLTVFGGEEPIRDTLSVRAGQELVVQSFPPFSLKGVLRSELDSSLTAQLKRYVQRPVVRSQPLLRLQVTGAVNRPGFVTVRGDAAVSDVVTAAGGLNSQSRLAKSSIKRGAETLISKDSLGLVFRTGMTLDQADVRAGDELVIGEKRIGSLTQLLFGASAAMGIVFSLISLTR